jgi:ParB-like chromosome segregation protein Spo0J
VTAYAIEILPLDQLRPWTRNARTHSRKQIRQIAESIRRFGFTNPVLIDGENRILAGHGRVEAARELGMATAPCLRIDHMSATDKRAYVLADNKLALNAGWDEELLALELKELMEADIDFGVDITGFSIAEVDQLIEGLAPTEPGDPADDRLPEPERQSIQTKWIDPSTLFAMRLANAEERKAVNSARVISPDAIVNSR